MKQENQHRMFWLMLAVVHIVAMIYLLSLCVHIAKDDAQTVACTTALSVVLLLITLDGGIVLIDYRRWRAQAQARRQADAWEVAKNIEVVICATGTALVTYRGKKETFARYETLCDGPAAMLQIEPLETLPQTGSHGARLSNSRATADPAHNVEMATTGPKQRGAEPTNANRRPAKGPEPAPAETKADAAGAQPALRKSDRSPGDCRIK